MLKLKKTGVFFKGSYKLLKKTLEIIVEYYLFYVIYLKYCVKKFIEPDENFTIF